MSLPPKVFSGLQQKWQEAVPNLDCKSDENFCTTDKLCKDIIPDLQPVGIQLSGQVFELLPAQYLFQADNNGKCFFVISECKLTGKNKDIYIMGDAFLKHFYSSFDFDSNSISLGVNTHSKGLVSMKQGEAFNP